MRASRLLLAGTLVAAISTFTSFSTTTAASARPAVMTDLQPADGTVLVGGEPDSFGKVEVALPLSVSFDRPLSSPEFAMEPSHLPLAGRGPIDTHSIYGYRGYFRADASPMVPLDKAYIKPGTYLWQVEWLDCDPEIPGQAGCFYPVGPTRSITIVGTAKPSPPPTPAPASPSPAPTEAKPVAKKPSSKTKPVGKKPSSKTKTSGDESDSADIDRQRTRRCKPIVNKGANLVARNLRIKGTTCKGIFNSVQHWLGRPTACLSGCEVGADAFESDPGYFSDAMKCTYRGRSWLGKQRCTLTTQDGQSGTATFTITKRKVKAKKPKRRGVRGTRKCGNDRPAFHDIRATNLSCAAARRILDESFSPIDPYDSSSDWHFPGKPEWKCKVAKGNYDGADFRCVNGRKILRFYSGG